MRFVSDILFESAKSFPDKEAVSDPNDRVTYRRLAEDVTLLAGKLLKNAVRPGDRCLLRAPNSVDFVRGHFAILAAGAVSVPCEPGTKEERFLELAKDAGACAVLIEANTARRLNGALQELKARVILLSDTE